MYEFLKGMDLSFVPQCTDEGMVIRDKDGKIVDALTLAKRYGVNSVRLRLWNEPANVPESLGYCSLEHTLRHAKQIKEAGLHFMLNFHYSDWWADPAQQNKPKAWAKLPFDELVTAVHDYTYETIKTLQAAGAAPDVVQIGNEIRSGFLFPDGELPNVKNMVLLLNAGIQGAKKAGGAEIMVHLDQGGRYLYLRDWFDEAYSYGLEDFDLIGLSYYPFWHGTFNDLKQSMEKLVDRYKKPIVLVETAHAWRKLEGGFINEAQERIAGVPATPAGQKQVLDLVMHINASLPSGMGRGIYYWEPLCTANTSAGSWAENMSLLDEEGRVLEGIEAFLFEPEDAHYDRLAFLYPLRDITVTQGESYRLQKEISALFYDGEILRYPISWTAGASEVDTEAAGQHTLSGYVEEIDQTVTVSLIVTREVRMENSIEDSNFEDGLTRWTVTQTRGEADLSILPEFIDPFPAPPLNAVRIESKSSFELCLAQQAYAPVAGRYRFEAELCGTDTTGVDVRLFAESQDEQADLLVHLVEHDWQTFSIEVDLEADTELRLGVRIQASPMYMMLRKPAFYRLD